MSTKILGNEELNILRAKTPYSLPDNPSDKGFNARQIKTKFWEGYLLLFNWLKDTQASLNNDFATTNSALLNESKRIDVILTYFSDGKANIAIKDRNNNIIDETYELKSEASSKFNQLIADIQSVENASGNKISGSQNINADGIQYTITLSNTQNATLSTITQYLPLATTLKAGLLSSTDKEKINNIESDLTNFLANAKAYTDEKLERTNIVEILGSASHTLSGLLSSEDKKKLDALYALLGEQEDADTVVNTINEVLAIFSTYPEGVDIVSQLEKKVNYSDVINTLDSEETSKPLSAKMGKELKTKVDTKAELAYVNEELDKKALKSDILVIDEAVTAQESEITTTQNEGDKLVDEIVGYVDGSPRGVYASLSALQSAFPSGTQGVYVCSDNGHWYYWSGTAWVDGGTYQATEIADGSIIRKKLNEDLKKNNDLAGGIPAFVNNYNINTTGTSKLYVHQGDILIVYSTVSKAVSLVIEPFISGDNYLRLYNNHIYEFTAPKNGYVGIETNGATVNLDIKLKTRFDTTFDSLYNNNKYIDKIKYNSSNLFNPNTAVIGKFIDTNGQEQSNSNYAYNIIECEPETEYITSGCNFNAMFYTKEMKPISTTSEMNFTTLTTPKLCKYFSASFNKNMHPVSTFMVVQGNEMPSQYINYYVGVKECFEAKGNYNTLKDRIDFIQSHVAVEEYHVGTGYQYTSLTQCFKDLKNNTNQKIIYIHEGTYDIFNEYGGSAYMNTITSDMNWYDASVMVPENTKLVGVGYVVLQFTPETNQITQIAAEKIACLNVWKNCEIENIHIISKNCRYSIHDEWAYLSENTYKTKKYKNITCDHSYTNGYGYPLAYACGIGIGCNYIFENCTFKSHAGGNTAYFHNTEYNGWGIGQSGRIDMNNVVFMGGDGRLTLQSTNLQDQRIVVCLNNVFFEDSDTLSIFSGSGSYSFKNAYDVTIKGGNIKNVSISQSLTNNYEPIIFN